MTTNRRQDLHDMVLHAALVQPPAACSADEGRVRASVIGVAIKTLKVEGLKIKELSENSGNAAMSASIAP
ncbi:hypothetical protein DL767_005029 [Monosporascus sp. MG133]|nr:hypothetical protein DL767_005029 [Monosporascus sp. MG133]